MTWFLLSILSALFDGMKNLYAKKLTKQFDEYLLAFSTSIIIVLCLLPIVWFLGIPSIGEKFIFSMLITGIINAITLVLILKAIKLTDISLVAPLFSLSPALLLITSPFIIGEFPSLIGLIGIFCIMLGTYILNFKKKFSLEPITCILKNDGQKLILIVAILWAISSNFYKIGMENSSPIFFIFLLNVFISILLFPFMLRKARFIKLRNNWMNIIPLGILSAGTSVFQWIAASMTLIIYALSIKRLSILISVVGGIFLFKEKKSFQRIIATMIILLGIYLITVH
jgi:drug/metabolite transporter (DMT)-like permease